MQPLGRGGSVKIFSQIITDLIIITEVFVEQPLALPGSANNKDHRPMTHDPWSMTHDHPVLRHILLLHNAGRPLQIWRGGKGVSGHCLIWASNMLPPKLRHILGCLAFSEQILSKKVSTPVKSLFENSMGNPFFDFFKYWLKLFKKNEYKYGHSLFKSAFGINFWPREVLKRKIHKYAYLRIFNLTTSRSQKLSPIADLKR